MVPTTVENGPIINEKITFKDVFVISNSGEKLGILKLQDAITKAKINGLDLVLVATNANPPVCKIMDYNKAIYEQKKKDKKNERNHIETKELRFTVGTQDHDLQTKARQCKDFLSKGNKVKLSVKFTGREQRHPELGKDVLDRFLSFVENAKFESQPKLDGRNLITYIINK